MKYQLFDVDIYDLELSHVKNLIEREIIEGWYVEYKSQIPIKNGKIDSIKVSKSISAFANTNGGWIFWGVECSGNRPSSIKGIDISNFSNFEDQVAQTINSNINPNPIYHFKSIQLEDGKILFVIKVEESPIPPYITSQGAVFQRENNECKPIHDRYVLEKLNEKTMDYYQSIERFSRFDLPETLGQENSNQTFLELYLFPLPFDSFKFKDFYTASFFKEIWDIFTKEGISFKDVDYNSDKAIGLGFNSIYTSESSIIVRPINRYNLIYKSTTVEIFENGNFKFLFPITEFKANRIPCKYENSVTLKYILDEHAPQIKNEFVDQIKIIDGHELLLTISMIVTLYRLVLKRENFNFSNDIGFRARITDYWRKFIFFDDTDYIDKIKKYNLPLSPKSEIEIPEFKKGQSYTLDLSDEYEFIYVAKIILESIGLPEAESIKYYDIIKNSFKQTLND